VSANFSKPWFRGVSSAGAVGSATACLLFPPSATGQPRLQAPNAASVGEAVTISATGLRSFRQAGLPRKGFNYRVTFDEVPEAKRAGQVCVRNIDTSYVGTSDTRTFTWRGSVPTTLRCYSTRTQRYLRTVRVRPGTYRWVVGVKTGKASWDRRASLIVERVRVR
jgi:hypothetical protein